tara:strand:+ start:494 stop:742 length:249 start_codon:yes stop_codon:yes gene_type:complete
MAIVDRHAVILNFRPLLEPFFCQLMDSDGILASQPFRSAHILVIGVVNAPQVMQAAPLTVSVFDLDYGDKEFRRHTSPSHPL